MRISTTFVNTNVIKWNKQFDNQIIIFSAGGRSEKLGAQTKVVLKIGFVADPCVVNPIPTRICHMIYCHSDKSYLCLVGIGLNYFSKVVIERQNDLSN